MTDDELSAVDREAMRRAIELTKAESSGRRQQLEAMLQEDGFAYAGAFAARHQQARRLGLKPWESPPSEVDEAPVADPHRHGLLAAWKLRQRLFNADLSVYEPNPAEALARIEARAHGELPPAA